MVQQFDKIKVRTLYLKGLLIPFLLISDMRRVIPKTTTQVLKSVHASLCSWLSGSVPSQCLATCPFYVEDVLHISVILTFPKLVQTFVLHSILYTQKRSQFFFLNFESQAENHLWPVNGQSLKYLHESF